MPITGAPPPGATITFIDTEVYNANAPTTWTDLDLSSTIGANNSLVLLRIENTHTIPTSYHFRENGRTEDVAFTVSYAAALSMTGIDAGHISYTWVKSDIAGIIEWGAENPYPTTIHVIAHLE